MFLQKAGFLYVEEAFSKSEAKYRRRVVLAVSQNFVAFLQMLMLRNMLIRLRVPLASGCLVMLFLVILPGLLLVKSKIMFSGFSGSVEIES